MKCSIEKKAPKGQAAKNSTINQFIIIRFFFSLLIEFFFEKKNHDGFLLLNDFEYGMVWYGLVMWGKELTWY